MKEVCMIRLRFPMAWAVFGSLVVLSLGVSAEPVPEISTTADSAKINTLDIKVVA